MKKAIPITSIFILTILMFSQIAPIYLVTGSTEFSKHNFPNNIKDSLVLSTEEQEKAKGTIEITKIDPSMYSAHHPCPNSIQFYEPVPGLDVNGYIVWAVDYKTLGIFLSRLPRNTYYEIYNIVTAAYVEASYNALRDASMGLMGIAFIPNQMVFSTKATTTQYIDPNMDNPLDLTKTYFGLEDAKKLGLDISGKGVRVGLIDSGVNPYVEGLRYLPNGTLREIELEIAPGLNKTEPIKEDMAGHGTHVATILVGSGYYYDSMNKDVYYYSGVEGYMPYATLVSIKVLNKDGYGELAWVIEGFDIALNKNLTVVNMSFGSGAFNGTNDLIAQAAENLWKKGEGVPLVAAAGNEGPMGSSIGSPAVVSNVISVGGFVGRNEEGVLLWVGSSWGPGFYSKIGAPGVPKPELLGVSVNVYGINWKTGGIRKLSGTSMATPMITGLVGILRENYPNISSGKIVTALLKSAEDLGESVERQGLGIPNLAIAAKYIERFINGSSPQGQIVINPPRIDTKNFVYRAQIIHSNSTFYIGIYASNQLTVSFRMNDTKEFNLELVNTYNNTILLQGYNYFKIVVGVNDETMEPIHSTLFVDVVNGSEVDGDQISFNALPRFPEGRVLFDASKDADTMFGYFIGDNAMGKYSYLSYLLEEDGFEVESNFGSRLTDEALVGYNILVISDPDKLYDQGELNAINNFILSGGSVILFAWGLNMFSENFYHGNSSIETLNQIAKNYGFYFGAENTTEDIVLAETQNYFGEGYTALVNWGPEIHVTNKEKVTTILKNYHGDIFRSIDILEDKIYGVITPTNHNGYILGFSSSYLFNNEALKTGYGLIDAEEAINAAIKIFHYVLKPRQAQVQYSLEGTLHKGDDLKIFVRFLDNFGNPVKINETTRRMWMFTPYLKIIPITLYEIDKDQGYFGVLIPGEYLNYYGEYVFYTPFSYKNLIPTNGKFTVQIVEPLFKERRYMIDYSVTLLLIITTTLIISVLYEDRTTKKMRKTVNN